MDLGIVTASCQSYAKSATPIAQPKIHSMSVNNYCFLTKATQPKPHHCHLSTHAITMLKHENIPWFFGHVTSGTCLTFMCNMPNLHHNDDLACIPATLCSDGGVRLMRAAQVDRSQSSLMLRQYMSSTSCMGFPIGLLNLISP